jgi:hypothetical protein
MLAASAPLGCRSYELLRRAAARPATRRRYDAAAVSDAPITPVSLSPEALLEREQAGRTRAGVSALVAAVAVTFAYLLGQRLRSGAPGVLITDALRDAAGQDKGHGLLTENILYLHDKVALSGAQAVLQIVGWIGFALLLLYLYDAAKARRPAFPAWVRSMLLATVVAAVVGTALVWIARTVSINDFAGSADHSSKAARDALDPSLNQIAGPLLLIGQLGIVVAWVLVSLNGMRVGLLTRFQGMLGILGAVFTILMPLLLPVIQIVWLVYVGLTVLGKSPSGTPPAWFSGKAEPWPTQQEAREQREREEAGTLGGADLDTGDAPSPATSSRKRKRRS